MEKEENVVKDFVVDFAKMLEEKRISYVNEMVEHMKSQADTMQRARKDGIKIEELIPEIKEKYDESVISKEK